MSADVLRRILIRANDDSAGPNTLFLFDEALRDERRAVVERIKSRLDADLGIRVTATFWTRILEEAAS